MRTHLAKASVWAVIIPSILFCITGCGPTFFSSKGTIASSGGELGQWSSSPAMCDREEFDGDSSKLIRMEFAGPPNTDPDRDVHQTNQRKGPYELNVAKNGSGYMAQIKLFNDVPGVDGIQGVILDSSSCRTLTFDRTEHTAGFGEMHPTLNGTLVMDCTYKQSHVTANIRFKKCGM
jgi:hypothetical protein